MRVRLGVLTLLLSALPVACGSAEERRPNRRPGRRVHDVVYGRRRRRPASTSCTSTACRASFYYPEIMAPGVGALSTTTTTATSMSTSRRDRCSATSPCSSDVSPPAGPLQRPAVSQRPVTNAGRHAHYPVHGRHRAERNRHPVLRHGRRGWRLSTTTGASTSIAPASSAACCSATTATARSPTSRHEQRHRRPRAAGASRRRSSTTTATAGSTSSSATTCIYSSRRRPVPQRHGPARLLPAEQLPRAAEPAVPQPPQRHVRGRDRRRRSSAARTAPRSASPRPTSTATGGSISTSPTTAQPNQLWINQRDGTFKDTALLAGAAVSGAGNAEASMGVDAGDFDNDGDEDLFVTNWLDQMNALYVNDGTGNFEDREPASGLGAPSLAKTGFGAGWLDFDNDGWLDLLVANGGVATHRGAGARANDPFPLQDVATAVSEPGQRPVRGRLEPRRRRCSRSRTSVAARRSATSTTTATPTSSSATPPDHCACSSTEPEPQPLGRAAPGRREASPGATWWARGWRSSRSGLADAVAARAG